MAGHAVADLEREDAGGVDRVLDERVRARVLDLAVGDGVTCHAVCFTPGLAP